MTLMSCSNNAITKSMENPRAKPMNIIIISITLGHPFSCECRTSGNCIIERGDIVSYRTISYDVLITRTARAM